MGPRLQMTSGGLSGSVSPFLGSVFLQVGFCFREAPFQGAFLGSSKLLLCFPVTSHRSEGTSSLNASQVPGLSFSGMARGQFANRLRGTGMSPHHCGRERRALSLVSQAGSRDPEVGSATSAGGGLGVEVSPEREPGLSLKRLNSELQ